MLLPQRQMCSLVWYEDNTLQLKFILPSLTICNNFPTIMLLPQRQTCSLVRYEDNTLQIIIYSFHFNYLQHDVYDFVPLNFPSIMLLPQRQIWSRSTADIATHLWIRKQQNVVYNIIIFFTPGRDQEAINLFSFICHRFLVWSKQGKQQLRP